MIAMHQSHGIKSVDKPYKIFCKPTSAFNHQVIRLIIEHHTFSRIKILKSTLHSEYC